VDRRGFHAEIVSTWDVRGPSSMGEVVMAKCPHCDEYLTLESTKQDAEDEVERETLGTAKKEVMYACPHCNSILGFAIYFDADAGS
jgi:uncharacterized protein with PIN domain